MTTWHLTPDHWQAYAGGRLGPDAEAAVETHVTACATCRASARALIPDPAPTWRAVHARIERPRPALPLRLLGRLGAPDRDLVVVAAADDLKLPWSLAVGGAIASVVISAQAGRFDGFMFLLLAPLVPLLAVAAAFDATDPMRELTNTTPFPRLRLALLRTLATLAVALPAVMALGLVVPGLHDVAWLWLLPALGLTSATLTLLTWTRASTAAGVVAGLWVVTVSATQFAGRIDVLGRDTVQLLFAVATLGLVAVFVATSTRPQSIGAAR